MRRTLLALLLLAGCPAPSRYAVQRPGLSCERATRVAYRTVLQLGWTVTSLVPANPARPGQIAATRTRPESGPESVRVVITCDGSGAVLQPVEGAFLPNFEFSRAFGYGFTTLVQRPDEETPHAVVGLQVLVHAIAPQEAVLDLDGVPTAGGQVPVRVTVRNNTDRDVAVDPARIDLVPAEGAAAGPLTGAALAAALAPGAAGDRVRAEILRAGRVAAHTTRTGYLVYPPGAYREARIAIEDVETGESEGFVTPVE